MHVLGTEQCSTFQLFWNWKLTCGTQSRGLVSVNQICFEIRKWVWGICSSTQISLRRPQYTTLNLVVERHLKIPVCVCGGDFRVVPLSFRVLKIWQNSFNISDDNVRTSSLLYGSLIFCAQVTTRDTTVMVSIVLHYSYGISNSASLQVLWGNIEHD